ncbi:MAG: twin-arginine translocase subunit TatC [Halobacteria archaeon]|nr:twin-arginine translocase subunit TatC [Halobacteria archaeon]
MADDLSAEVLYNGVAEVADSARKHLIKIVVTFLIGMLATIAFLRVYLFEAIESKQLALVESVRIVYVEPFEVILLQAKIGMIAGAVLVLPLVVYYGRKPLKERGVLPNPSDIPNKKTLTVFGVSVVALFVGGVAYAYFFMLPFIFRFVSQAAIQQGIKPTYRISKFVTFVLAYSAIFGFAAELPLAMTFAVKSGITTYDFLKSKWRHFTVVAAFVSAMITSPDPMTQLVVLGPIVGIYFVGLGVIRVVAPREIKRDREMRRNLSDEEDEDSSLGLFGGSDDSSSDSETVVEGAETESEASGGTGSESGDTEDTEPKPLEDRGLIDVASSVAGALKTHTAKIVGVFLVVTGGIFYWLLYAGIETIQKQTVSYMSSSLQSQVNLVLLEPFEMVFLVVKLSLIAGVVALVPVILYLSRNVLISEGVISGDGSKFFYVSRALILAGLFAGGVAYAYLGMVPVLVSLLSRSIVDSGMLATYTIQEFINFVLMISFVFGFIAEMPAVMYVLVSTKVARFETLKSKWREFTVGVFALGAIITSPDPFTMVVVAVPLSGFYLVSLGITRVVCHGKIKEVREENESLGVVEDGGIREGGDE